MEEVLQSLENCSIMKLQKALRRSLKQNRATRPKKNEGGKYMGKWNQEVGLAQAKTIAEEVFAMINVCFECKTKLEANLIHMTLPTGESFCIEVSRA
jgi:hypothetical protein